MPAASIYSTMERKVISIIGAVFIFTLVLCFGGSRGEETTPTAEETTVQEARVSYADYDESWEQYKTTFNKTYTDANEEVSRKSVFIKRVKSIEEHNQKYNKGESSYWMDINQFTDMTEEELANSTCDDQPDSDISSGVCTEYVPSNQPAPDSIDWRTLRDVTDIKDQGKCGSCWAFASTSTMESHWAIKKNQLIDLSEQQVLDCAKQNGCKGGSAEIAYGYASHYGMEAAINYPYEATDNNCRYKSWLVDAKFTGCHYIWQDENKIQLAVGKEGPVYVSIHVSESFRNYKGGIYHDTSCSGPTSHAVVLVGYGSAYGRIKYWIVRNSWGTQWGMGGYMKMLRGQNICEVAKYGRFPLVGVLSQGVDGSSQNSTSSNGTNGTTGTNGKGGLDFFQLMFIILCSCLAFLKW